MKKIKTIIAAVCVVAGSLYYSASFAQAPRKFTYQTVVRNSSQALLQNSNCGIKITIRSGSATGTVVYSETHTKTSNINGLVTLEIGAGTVVSGTMAGINWGANTYFVQTQIDPAGGTNYTISGTNQLLSVPYALNAGAVKVLNGAPNPDDGKIVEGEFGAGLNIIGVGTTANGSDRKTRLWGDFIMNDGRMGIGTISPSCPLDVNSFVNQSTVNGHLLNAFGTNGYPAGNMDITIKASHAVSAINFLAQSDNRIKNQIGITDGSKDLSLLKQLKITDYTYIDKLHMDNRVIKKVIAQQVEGVYPNAVYRTRNYIPNIYAVAREIKFDNGSLQFTLNKNHDLKVNDKVKWMNSKGEPIFSNVTKIVSDECFEIAYAIDIKDAFIYGKEVDDFRVVDYEALTTLNISATQELFKMITELQAQNEKLKIENNNTKASIESIMQQMQTLNAKVNTIENPVTGQVEKK